jgi:hypothetical protein
VDDFIRDLKSKGLEPAVIGEVVERGVKPEVVAPAGLREYVADQRVLSEFTLA